jgi:hypothetical protein
MQLASAAPNRTPPRPAAATHPALMPLDATGATSRSGCASTGSMAATLKASAAALVNARVRFIA